MQLYIAIATDFISIHQFKQHCEVDCVYIEYIVQKFICI